MSTWGYAAASFGKRVHLGRALFTSTTWPGHEHQLICRRQMGHNQIQLVVPAPKFHRQPLALALDLGMEYTAALNLSSPVFLATGINSSLQPDQRCRRNIEADTQIIGQQGSKVGGMLPY